MVTKNRFVIVFQSVFVVIFALGMLFPAGMVVNAEDLPPTETTVVTEEEAPPEEPPPETETVVTPAEEVVVPAVVEPVVEPAVEPAAEPVIEPPAVEEVVPAVDPALVPEVLPTEDPLLVPMPLPAASGGESSEEELDTPAEVLEALPAEAELVVLDENGEALPLVAVEAEEALVTGDPMYCAGTDAPGSASCITYTTIEAAVAHAQTTGNGDCTIYVAQDYNNPSTSTINIDQGDHPSVVLNMFLVGGYDLTSGSSTFGTLVGTTTLNQNFSIDDITGSLTLANFIIKEFTTSNTTIKIDDSVNVTLNNMTINNKGSGSAVSIEDSHGVTISNSTINEKSDGYGIKMTHSYDILIIKTTVNEYGKDGGIYMNNVHDVNLDTVTVDSNDDYCNGSGCSKDAIFVKAGKDIYLTGVNANSQFGSGFHSVDGSGYLSLISSVFDDNHHGFGVLVEDHNGVVYLEKVSASDNEYEGVKIQNKGDVTIKDSSILDNDGEYGLLVHAKNIEIGGTHVDNNKHNGAGLDAGGWIKILTSSFSDNDTGYGLNAEAEGPIDISESAFDHNGWYILKGGGPPPEYRYGAHLYSDLDITITDSTFNNNFNEGLYAEAGSGGVAPSYVSVMGGGWPPPPPPTIGNILLDGVSASNNGYAGEESGHGSGFAYGAQLYTNGTLTILDSAFNHNRDYGVFGDAEGDIKVSGTSVNNNQGWEYMDYGAMFKGGSSIQLLKSTFDNNYGPGLQVYVDGDILADGISANGNMDWQQYCHWMYPGYGALLNTKFGGVEIANAFFDGNEGFGLFVWAKNDVTINTTSASNNMTSGFWHSPMESIMLLGGGGPGPAYFLGEYNGDGAYIFSMNGSVVINNSTFDKNAEDGLGVEAGKDITLFKVSASGNGDDGAELMAHGNITATCSTFMDNGDWGLKSGAYGLLSSTTLNSDTFGGNGWDDYLIWAGDLVVNLGYPCGTAGGGPGGAGDGGPFIPGWLLGVIPVTGGEFMALSCTGISVIQLPTREETIFNQPMCGYMASMELVTPDDLPGKLPVNWKYIDGFTVTLMFGNEVVVQLPTGASDTLVFPLSEDQVKQEFHILFWDVSLNGGLGDWVDLGGVKEALKWVKTHNQTGTFLLVQ